MISSSPTVRRALLAQAASIPVTGLFLCAVARPPHLYQPVLAWLLRYSVFYAVAALLCSGAMCLAACLLLLPVKERPYIAEPSLRVMRVALWCAPVAILFRRFPPGAMIAAVALIVTATRFIYEHLESGDPPSDPEVDDEGVGTPMAVSAALHCSFCAFLLRSTGLFPALLVLSAALGTVLLLSRGGERRTRPATLSRSVIALATTFLACVALILVGTVARYSRGAGGFVFRFVDAIAAARISGQRAPDGVPKESPEKPEWAAVGAKGGFPGVILWPRIKPVTTLIEPLPSGAGFARPFARQFGIPFGGEYWMYRDWWATKPPANSLRKHGSPVALSFSTTDGFPLQMEARHRFDQPLGIRCCREIQMEIRNGDTYSSGIAMELILVDLQSGAAQTLGREPVRSEPDTGSDPPKPVIETLTFRIPPSPSIRQFDLLQVRFLRMNRADKSSRIAIERFVLLP